MLYRFPVVSPGNALEVTEASFDIREYPELYVDLDNIRISKKQIDSDYRQNIKTVLKINKENVLEEISHDYLKILFSGYRGSGKTVEMRRLHKDLHNPERYFSVLIELEKELAIDTFQFEDYFILLIYKFANEIDKLNIITDRLDDIIKDWLSETEIEKEYTKEKSIKNENELETGLSFFGFLKAKFNIKTELAAGTKTARIIREKVKKNPLALIEKFNIALSEIRDEIQQKGEGKDILFIVDGSEKMPIHVYERLFIKDAYIFRSINANIISTLPIHALYNLQYNSELSLYNTFLVPVVKITKESIKEFREIITKRLNEKLFFEEGVLDYFVRYSGGVVREITKIVNAAIVYARGEKITQELAEKTIRILGKEMDEKLTTQQYEFLSDFKKGKIKRIRIADKETGDLIYSLVLLKYNGTVIIHPLLDKFID